MALTIDIPAIGLLRSNTALSRDEDQFIQAESLTLEADISRMASEIEKLQSTLEKLIVQHREKANLLSSYRALRTPIRRLPPQVLEDIFFHCLPDQEYVETDVDCAPLILGRVCSYWRTISVQTPKLWASLSIPSVWLLGGTGSANLADLWLSRSRNLPLSIKLPLRSRSDTIINACHKHRCRKIDIPAGLLVRYSFRVNAETFPTLEEITVTRELGLLDRPFSISGPMIKRAEIADAMSCMGTSNVLPWSQLTHLTFSSNVVGPAPLAPLSMCRDLEQLDSTFTGWLRPSETRVRAEIPFSVFTLPKLRSWKMHISGSTTTECFLDAPIMPALRKFEFSCTACSCWSEIQPKILSLVSRSSSPLEHFEIRAGNLGYDEIFPFPEEDVIQLVQSCPSLQTLVISYKNREVVYPSITEILACRNSRMES